MKDLYAIRWFYVRNEKNHPIGVVATKRIPARDHNNLNDVIVFAVSSLSPKDTWDVVDGEHKHHFGLQIALGRLHDHVANRLKGQYVFPGMSTDIKTQIMDRLASSTLPRFAQVRAAAKYWLSDEAKAARALKRVKPIPEEEDVSEQAGSTHLDVETSLRNQ